MHRIVVIILLLAMSGCARKVPMVHQFSSLPEQAACRVALLPLVDKGSFPRGGALFYKIFLTEMIASGHFRLVEEGDVLELYRQYGMYPNQQPDSDQLKMLGGRLEITLFIGGDILKMGENRSGEFLDTDLTIVLRLYDGQTGRKIWTTYHRRRGLDYQQVLHFGRINTLTSLAKRMSGEIIELWLENGMIPCTD